MRTLRGIDSRTLIGQPIKYLGGGITKCLTPNKYYIVHRHTNDMTLQEALGLVKVICDCESSPTKNTQSVYADSNYFSFETESED